MNQRIILYERVQEEYDQFLQELLQLDKEAIVDRLHELIVKTTILELIVEEMYTEEEMKVLLVESLPLHTLYRNLNRYI